MPGRMKAPARGAAVRMYRGFFGDCFLIALRKTDKTTAYVLIDCGDWNQRKDVLIPIAEDIEAATGGKLDVIVATHEHSDHLSGFNVARAVFDRMEVGQVWLSWLDDPTNTLADRLKTAYGKKQAAVRLALDRWEHLAQGLNAGKRAQTIERINGIRAVLAFDDAHENLAAAGRPTIADAVKYLKGKGKEEPHYCYPGEPVLSIPGVNSARVYVLGPPENEAAIKDMDPDKTDPETYEFTTAITQEIAFLAAAGFGGGSLRDLPLERRRVLERSYPFENHHQVPPGVAKQSFGAEYYKSDHDWRTIEEDWLSAAEELALHLNSYTNNTSLVLAIELVSSENVLLFVADAQVGNWLSWQDVHWSDRGDGKACTARDLLARTTLYKVGHHASHNATLREQGLELMQGRALTALIPVDEAFARARKPYPWDMPFPPLYRRLRQLTEGRILRADKSFPTQPTAVNDTTWKRFRDRVTPKGDGLYWEIVVR